MKREWVSGEPRRSLWGGGAGAAWQPPYGSVEPPPASGIGAAGSLRQWAALQRCVLGQWKIKKKKRK